VGYVCALGSGISAGLHRDVAIKGGVNPSVIVIILECGELSLEVKAVPE
jgi:hypothetical protein